jgi:hypothetical protein
MCVLLAVKEIANMVTASQWNGFAPRLHTALPLKGKR